MKIAIFTDTFLPQINGVTNTLNHLLSYLEKSDIEYIVFAPEDDSKEREVYNIERFFSIKFFLYPECRIAFPNSFRVNSILQDFNPDAIQLMSEFNVGLAGLKYGKKYNIPTISNYTTNFSQYLNYYKLDMLNDPVWNYMRWFHNQNDLTLCPSEEIKTLLKNNGIINTSIFSRGIDLSKFNPNHKNYKFREEFNLNNKLVFLYVGRVAPEKDLDTLINSYNKIHNKYKEKIALIITGDGPYLDKCKNELPKDTIFIGFKKGDALSEIYASSDIFVFPSSTETFGNVVLEAMASGIPVIGADAGGVKNIITHRETGLKFKPKNSQELTLMMEELIEKRELREKLKAEALNMVSHKSWNKIFDNLLGNYEDIILRKENDKFISA